MPTVRRLTTAEASNDLLAEIRRLFDEAFEGDFSNEDWKHALGGWHVVVEVGDAVVSHAAVVPRTLEVAGRPVRTGYVEGVATAAKRRREGLGSLAMAEITELVRREFELRASRRAFTACSSDWVGNDGRARPSSGTARPSSGPRKRTTA